MKQHIAEKLINEVRSEYFNLDLGEIFNNQTSLISKVNKTFSASIFNNYVPNYRNLASISQIFNKKVPVKQRILLETQITGEMIKKTRENVEFSNNDFGYESVITKFNEKYETVLTENQKKLLGKYVTSFADNGLELKAYINEEIHRLKGGVSALLESDEIKSDKDMQEKTKKVLSILEGYKSKPFTKEILPEFLKIQSLTEEFTI